MPERDPSAPLFALERRDFLVVIGIWATWTLGTLLLAFLAAVFPGGNPSAWGPELTSTAPPLARWDAGWYRSVAQEGYHFDAAATTNNVRFYPLYPLAMRLVSTLTGLSFFTSGIAISIASLLIALLILADLVKQETGADRIPSVLMSLLFFPTAFYFAAVYSESLFLLSTLAAFWAARQRRWVLSGVAGAAASLTRLNGFLILVPVAYLAWRELRERVPSIARPLMAVGLILAGAAAYPVFLWRRFGTPMVYFHLGAGWTHKPTPPWSLARRVGSEFLARVRSFDGRSGTFFLCFFTAILFIAISVAVLFRGPRDGALYAIATMLLLATSGSIDAIPRYVLPLFPCFMLVGGLLYRSAILSFAYVFLALGVFGILLHRFVHWIWVA
jgi:mannosyltransferase PIG-V